MDQPRVPLLPPVVEFETIDSTNTEAHRRAAAGDRGPLWIRAERQEQGRGRSGRAWSSPPGNLSATFMFVPGCPLKVLYQMSFVAGVAAHAALAAWLPGDRVRLKWPNDVLIADAKTGGILVESSAYGRDTLVMVGIGINIAVAPEIDGRQVTRLADHGASPGPRQLLDGISGAMAHWLGVWQRGEAFGAVRAAWLERAHAPGQPLSVNTGGERLEGTFVGLADSGALLLRLANTDIRRVEHGDVALAGPVPVATEE